MQTKAVIIIITMLFSSILLEFLSYSEKIIPNKPFDSFPLEIGQWKGVKDELDTKIYNILGVEDYIMANFYSADKKMVNLYVGFYQSQREGDLIHSPKNCMPGSGWNIIETSQEVIEIDNNVKINSIKLLLQKGSEKQIVLYWFQSRGRIVTSEYMEKIWLVVDSIIKHRTDGSFVRFISPLYTNENETVEGMKEFVKIVFPYLNDYIPS
jgi:EpsI family protein